jgi:long-chain fatty acid transport protein
MISVRKIATVVATVMLTLSAGSAYATNGYFTHGTGTKNKGMAGAGLAMPGDAISIANNPAAAVFATGRLDAGAALFSPLRSYSSSESLANGNGGAFTIGPNDLQSSREYFVIPHIAYSWALGTDSAFALAFYGRGGMNSEWDGGTATFDPSGQAGPPGTFDGTFGGALVGQGATAGVDLSQAFLDITYARKAGDNFAWGAGLVVAVQSFAAKGVGTFGPFTETFAEGLAAGGPPGNPTNLSNNGHEFSYGVGAKVGFQANLGASTTFAASYVSEIGMTELDSYADLFAEDGGFDIPANAKIGLTFRPRDTVAISIDAEHTWFSDVASVGNAFGNLFSCLSLGGPNLDTCLGGANGAGFGWDDMTIYKVGIEWGVGSDMVWRAGYSHGDQPIAETEVMFNILAPAVIEDHFAAGFTRKSGQSSEWSLSVMYAPSNEVTGPNPFDPTQTITIEMYQWEVEFGYSWNFE